MGLRELYGDMYRWVMGSIAHPLRGIIIENPDQTQWQAGMRKVTINVTPSGASYPRTYNNVPYSGIGDSTDFQKPPNSGDYVDVIFKGGSTEFPTVIGRHGGQATAAIAAQANASQSTAPTQTIALGTSSTAFPWLFPETGDLFSSFVGNFFRNPIRNAFNLIAPPEFKDVFSLLYPSEGDGNFGLVTVPGFVPTEIKL